MDLTGQLCVCRAGRIGRADYCLDGVWHGLGLLDGRPWQSRAPRPLNAREQTYLHELMSSLDELVGGDGMYYVTQEREDEESPSNWPDVIPHPENPNGRLIKRIVPRKEHVGQPTS